MIKKVMSSIFSIPVEDISDNTSSETISSWDSLNHMKLIVALEEEFNVEFSDDQILNMFSYSSIAKIISELNK